MFTCLFWNLIYHPYLPLEEDSSAQLQHRPAHVIDAKALYDLLTKDEIQASIGAGKRAAVETLVPQDKLKVCQAHIRWVSSERQYADSMTKTEASQLLADRLRTHRTKLISDDSFQASKKKTPQQRKHAAEMFATKRTSKALTAHTMAATTTTAAATDNYTQQATDMMICYCTFLGLIYGLALLPAVSQHFIHFTNLTFNYIRNYLNMMRHWLRGPDQPEPEEEEDLDPVQQQENQQNDNADLQRNDDVELLRLREVNQLLEGEVQQLTRQLDDLEAQLTETTNLLEISRGHAGEWYLDRQLYQHRFEQLRDNFEEILQERLNVQLNRLPPNDDVQALVNERINQLIRRPVHFTRGGEVWHFSRLCCQQRTTGQVMTRRPCAWCSDNMRLLEDTN